MHRMEASWSSRWSSRGHCSHNIADVKWFDIIRMALGFEQSQQQGNCDLDRKLYPPRDFPCYWCSVVMLCPVRISVEEFTCLLTPARLFVWVYSIWWCISHRRRVLAMCKGGEENDWLCNNWQRTRKNFKIVLDCDNIYRRIKRKLISGVVVGCQTNSIDSTILADIRSWIKSFTSRICIQWCSMATDGKWRK